MTPEEYKQLLPKRKKKPKPYVGFGSTAKYHKELSEDQFCMKVLVPMLELWEITGQLQAQWNKVTNETGASGSVIYGMKLKRMGKKPGMGDYLFEWGTGSGWIEAKTKTGRQTPPQKRFQAGCEKRGIKYAVVRTWEELEAALESWGILK